MTLTRLHKNPILSLGLMKQNNIYGSSIRDIGLDKFFVHFWNDLQLKMYKEFCSINKYPAIVFDATVGCCKKIKREDKYGSQIFLYEGIIKVKQQALIVLSMLSEQHDSLSIYLWLKKWIRCNVQPPKITISDQSLALMSALVQSFTQFNSLEHYLDICFKLFSGNIDEEVPYCYIR